MKKGKVRVYAVSRADPGSNTLKLYYRTVQLSLPKFSISASYQLDQILPHLGFTEVFSPQSNFSGISEQQNMMMTQVSPQVSGFWDRNLQDMELLGSE